jgi:hypothetical protein
MTIKTDGNTDYVYCDNCDMQYVFENTSWDEIYTEMTLLGWVMVGDEANYCANCKHFA